jgi:hypothetical protein
VFRKQDLKESYQILVPLLSTKFAKGVLQKIGTVERESSTFHKKVSLMRVYIPKHKKNDKSEFYQESLHNLQEAGVLGLTP